MKEKLRIIIEDNTSPKGKIFTFFILLIGIGVVTVPAGLVASALSKAREIEGKDNLFSRNCPYYYRTF